MASLTIVIPTLGRAPSLRDVLAGLERQEPPLRDVAVLVCLDPGGAERLPVELAEVGLPARLVRPSRPGASAARNAGWRAAETPLVLFLDDDLVPSARLVAEHLAWHERHPEPEVAVLGAIRWSPRVRVTPFMRWLEQGVLFDFGSIAGREAGWGRLYSANVSFKSALLARVGGFDEEEFPFLYEDLDLGLRLSRHRLRLLYNRGALGEHLKSETPESWAGRLEVLARAERRFVRRYPDQRPYFYERFREAAAAPPAPGRSARLAAFVPPSVPWLGPRVWYSYSTAQWQRLAPRFLAVWETAPP